MNTFRPTALPPITLVVVCLALFMAYFPICLFSSMVEPFWTARAAGPLGLVIVDAVVCLGLCAFVAMVLLVWPMAFAGYLLVGTPVWRVATVSMLWVLPAVGFGYFVGEFRNILQVYDYFVAIVLPVITAVVLYRRTQRWVETSVFLTAVLFLGIFLLGDILGPFPTFVKFSAASPVVYGLRTLCTAATLAAALFIPVRPEALVVDKSTRVAWVAGLAITGIIMAVVRHLIDESGQWAFADLAPVAMLIACVFFVREDRYSTRIALWICAAQVMTLGLPIARQVMVGEGSLWGQLVLGYQTVAMAAFIWVLWQLLRTQAVHHPREGRRLS